MIWQKKFSKSVWFFALFLSKTGYLFHQKKEVFYYHNFNQKKFVSSIWRPYDIWIGMIWRALKLKKKGGASFSRIFRDFEYSRKAPLLQLRNLSICHNSNTFQKSITCHIIRSTSVSWKEPPGFLTLLRR